MTPRQVQDEYGFKVSTLANWRWTGTGPDFIKTSGVSGRIKYKRSDIEAWLDAQTVRVGGQRAA
nr:helix-turn-helix domain-containing protein [Streptomyces gossypiisoli]